MSVLAIEIPKKGSGVWGVRINRKGFRKTITIGKGIESKKKPKKPLKNQMLNIC